MGLGRGAGRKLCSVSGECGMWYGETFLVLRGGGFKIFDVAGAEGGELQFVSNPKMKPPFLHKTGQ